MLSRIAHGVLVAWIIVAPPAGVARAAPFDNAMAAYERGDYAIALRLFRPLADQGEAAAQNNLGAMYANGQGVPRDYAEAVKWYRKAADQGYALAQTSLGFMYEQGQGVPQDYAQAHMWYRKAADQGDAAAQLELGVMYGEGQGVRQDYAEALRVLHEPARPNHCVGEAARRACDLLISREYRSRWPDELWQ
jgi:TPR repeat protein